MPPLHERIFPQQEINTKIPTTHPAALLPKRQNRTEVFFLRASLAVKAIENSCSTSNVISPRNHSSALSKPLTGDRSAKMKHLAAYLLLTLGGNTSPSAKEIKKVLSSVGIETDSDRVEKLLEEVQGKDINEVGAQPEWVCRLWAVANCECYMTADLPRSRQAGLRPVRWRRRRRCCCGRCCGWRCCGRGGQGGGERRG